MRLSRFLSMIAFAMAVAFLIALVPGAPKSASAQGPAGRFECNYTTAVSHALTVTSNQGYAVANNLRAGTTNTYVNSNVLFTLSGTSSFSGIANRRQLRATVTTTVLSSVAQTVPAVLAARGVTSLDFIRTTHVVEFLNYANNDGLCTTNEMCFVALGEGIVSDYAKNNQPGFQQGYDQLTDNNDNLDITLAVVRGEQQLKNLCGRLTNSRNSTSSAIISGATPNYDPAANPQESRTEWSKLTPNYLYFTFQGALCECQGNKSGPLDYGQQNNQSGGGRSGPGQI
ncbi:MAG: hypothetical protein ACK5RS_16850 [Acidobacteriota bacterium]